MGNGLGRGLKRPGASVAMEHADRALQRTRQLVGAPTSWRRIVNLLMVIFTRNLFRPALCGPVRAAGMAPVPGWSACREYARRHSQRMERVSDTLGPVCVGGLIIGCIGAAVGCRHSDGALSALAGLIGNWVRRLIWRVLLRRR